MASLAPWRLSERRLYYVLRGKGLVELDRGRILPGPHMGVFSPPGVKHGIYNAGLEDLVFIVVARPPDDMPH